MRLPVLFNALLITSAALTERSCSSSPCTDEDPVGDLSLLQTRIEVENIQACVPYSQDACETAAIEHGLQRGGVGYSFAGDYNTKGCYTYRSGQYRGHAYYGTGGSESDMQAAVSEPKARILGDDCEACVPYSQDACQMAAILEGLQCGGVGYSFAGAYSTKGCYKYTSGKYLGHAYYGTGGSQSAMQAPVSAPKARISGDDCHTPATSATQATILAVTSAAPTAAASQTSAQSTKAPTPTPTTVKTTTVAPTATSITVITASSQAVAAGAVIIPVANTTGLAPGMSLTIADGGISETNRIFSVNTNAVSLISEIQRLAAAGAITLDNPLKNTYRAGADITATQTTQVTTTTMPDAPMDFFSWLKDLIRKIMKFFFS